MRASEAPRCDDPTCPGWVHNNSSTGRSIQRCDDCKRYSSDDSARRAHAKTCPDPLCVYGKTQAARDMKAAIDDAVDAVQTSGRGMRSGRIYDYGDRDVCRHCGHDIEYQGEGRWADRGNGVRCLPYEDREKNEIVTPSTTHEPVIEGR